MKDQLAVQDGSGNAKGTTSALAFWAEVGAHLPDPDQIQLTLQGLDLGPEGGRLEALVPAERDNPLSRAAILEASLNRSAGLTTHGDYEARDGQVRVRLRMYYHGGVR